MHTEPMSGCWLWTAANNGRYGQICIDGRTEYSHRVAYEAMVGPISDGLVIDHLCRTSLCVNPDHMEPVTQRENTLRGVGPAAVNAKKTHCPAGHEYTEGNIMRISKGSRLCRECQRSRVRR